MTLYEIDEQIIDLVDDETGEIINSDLFDQLTMERDAKVENLSLYIKYLKAEAEALKNEEDAFKQRRRVAENKMNNLKSFLANYLEGTSFKTNRVAVSFRKSQSVNILNFEEIPEEFLKYKEPDVDKMAIKQAIKQGFDVNGVEIVESLNIQIK